MERKVAANRSMRQLRMLQQCLLRFLPSLPLSFSFFVLCSAGTLRDLIVNNRRAAQQEEVDEDEFGLEGELDLSNLGKLNYG